MRFCLGKPMPVSETARGPSRPPAPVASSPWRRLRLGWGIVFVRLRFFLVLAGAFAVVANWDFLQHRWQQLTSRAKDHRTPAQAESEDIEFRCAMCPGVVSDWPTKCPVCNMGLVPRRRGESMPAPDGGLARMQLSPYRVQQAGIQTTAVEFRPLSYEIVTGGFLGSLPEAPSVRTKLWLQADVYEKDLFLLAEGQPVEVSGDGAPGRTPFTGQVRKLVAPSSANASPRVQIEIDNPRSELRPGMFVTARIKVPPGRLPWFRQAQADEWRERTVADLMRQALRGPGGLSAVVGLEPMLAAACRQALAQQDRVLTVLDGAVIDTGTRKVVYREAGPGMFDAVEVVVGPRAGEFRPVLRGLDAGQRVAAAGAFLLDAETRLNPAVAAAYFGAAQPSAPARPARSDVAQVLARLSPTDRALALRQKTCPVTGEVLGSMGTPVRLEVDGKTVFLCCPGCEAELRENAARYLAKVPGG